MNDTTPPQGTPGASGTSEQVPPHSAQGPHTQPPSSFERTSNKFFSWLRGLGIERSSDRWFAGVAGGIAAKAHIDPLIVRGIFVVLAILGGPGILLYLAGWLLLPDHTGRIHLEELVRGRGSAGAIVSAVVLGAILVIPAIVWVFRTLFFGPWGWDSWGIVPEWMQVTLIVIWWAIMVPALIVWLIVWLVGRSGRGSQGAGAAGATAGDAHSFTAPASEQANEFAGQAKDRASEWASNFEQKAEAWGQRAEEKSKEWERRGREYHAAHRLSAGYVVLTLALALLAAGGAAGLALTSNTGNELALIAGLVAGVSVLAVSLIIAGIRGRDSGWIGFLSFCGVVALFFAPLGVSLPTQTEFLPFGDVNVQPRGTQGDSATITIAGNATVDLSGISAQERTVDVWLLAGNATVIMPDSVPAEVKANIFAGTFRDQRIAGDERRQSGVLISRTVTDLSGSSSSTGSVTVNVRLLGGSIKIKNSSGTFSQADRDRTNQIELLKERIEELEQAR